MPEASNEIQFQTPDETRKSHLRKRKFSTHEDSFLNIFSVRLKGHKLEDLVFIEIFSGSGGLTAEVRKRGLISSVGVDCSISKQVKSPTVRLDLTTAGSQALLIDMLGQPTVVRFHAAPLCGTASLAREIRKHLPNMPQPLRSQEEPDGLPNLCFIDKVRVQKANQLYDLVGRLCLFAEEHGLLYSVDREPGSIVVLAN